MDNKIICKIENYKKKILALEISYTTKNEIMEVNNLQYFQTMIKILVYVFVQIDLNKNI